MCGDGSKKGEWCWVEVDVCGVSDWKPYIDTIVRHTKIGNGYQSKITQFDCFRMLCIVFHGFFVILYSSYFSSEKICICEVNYSRQWVKDLEFKSFFLDSQFSVLSLEYGLALRHDHILLVYVPPGSHGFTREIRCTYENIKWCVNDTDT